VLITLPPSCADCHETREPQPPGTVKASPGLNGVALLSLYIRLNTQIISLRTLYSVSSIVIPPFAVTECNTHNSYKSLNAGIEQYL